MVPHGPQTLQWQLFERFRGARGGFPCVLRRVCVCFQGARWNPRSAAAYVRFESPRAHYARHRAHYVQWEVATYACHRGSLCEVGGA